MDRARLSERPRRERPPLPKRLNLVERGGLDDLGSPAPQAAELLFLTDLERVARGAEAQQAALLRGLADKVDRLDEPDHGRAVGPGTAVNERPAPPQGHS
jgi:hypothetical protein